MDIRSIDPKAAGFDPDRLTNAVSLLDRGAAEGIYPGAVLWASRKGITGLLHSTGHTDFSRQTPVEEHTLFDLASLTKPVITAPSILLLMQDGKLHLGQTVERFFPDRDLPHLRGVTIRHQMTHTSGLPAWRDLFSKGQTREQAIDELLAVERENEPGTAYTYSCLGYLILGLVVEAVTGTGLDKFAQERIFSAIGMEGASFNPKSTDGRAIAATDHCSLRKGPLIGQVHDGNAYAMGGVAGNAGLFGCIWDLALFCHTITNTTAALPYLPFSLAVIRLMFANAIDERIGGQTLGWFTFPNDMMPGGDLVSKASIGHSGFTGTVIIIDPQYELCCVLLSNRVCNLNGYPDFANLRRAILNAVAGSILC